jgi:hypothetical protein
MKCEFDSDMIGEREPQLEKLWWTTHCSTGGSQRCECQSRRRGQHWRQSDRTCGSFDPTPGHLKSVPFINGEARWSRFTAVSIDHPKYCENFEIAERHERRLRTARFGESLGWKKVHPGQTELEKTPSPVQRPDQPQ